MEEVNTVPSRLGKRGKALWEQTNRDYDLAQHELETLLEACRTLDLIETLRNRVDRDGVMSTGSMGQPVPNPLLQELRQNRTLFGQLIARLALPDLEKESGGLQVVPNQHRANIQSRWGRAHGATA